MELERRRSPRAAAVWTTVSMQRRTGHSISPVSHRSTRSGGQNRLQLGYFIFVTEIRERRCPLIDEEFGVVLSLPTLDHAATVHEAHLTDGRTVPIGVRQPFTWQIAELFKVTRDQIAQIEVVLNKVPYRMPSHWP